MFPEVYFNPLEEKPLAYPLPSRSTAGLIPVMAIDGSMSLV
jgi:hypothetical protein